MIILITSITFVSSFVILCLINWYVSCSKTLTGDQFFHLLIIRSLRDHKWKYPRSLSNVIFQYDVRPYNYLAYPPLFHYLVSLVPTRFYLRTARVFNIIVSSLLSSIVAAVTYILTSSFSLAFFSSFVTIYNISTFENVVSFNPRNLGMLLSFVMFLLILYPPSWIVVLVTAIIVMSISLTHKFATQYMFFSSIVFAIAFNRLDLFLSISAGFLLSLVVSRGFYFSILKEHFNWLYYYFLYPPRIRLLPKIQRVFVANGWYLLLVILSLFSLILSNGRIEYNDVTMKIIFFAFFPLLLSLVVSLPKLSFLGEEYRYIDYGIAPVGIATSYYMKTINIDYGLFPILLICIAFSSFALLKLKRLFQRQKLFTSLEDAKTYDVLKNYCSDNMLVFPHTRGLEVNYFTNIRIIHPVRSKHWDSNQLTKWIRDYKVGFVLKFKCDSKAFDDLAVSVKMEKILDQGDYELFKLTTLS